MFTCMWLQSRFVMCIISLLSVDVNADSAVEFQLWLGINAQVRPWSERAWFPMSAVSSAWHSWRCRAWWDWAEIRCCAAEKVWPKRCWCQPKITPRVLSHWVVVKLVPDLLIPVQEVSPQVIVTINLAVDCRCFHQADGYLPSCRALLPTDQYCLKVVTH